jgi:hypothetical protein
MQVMIFVFPMLQYEEDCTIALAGNLRQVDLASRVVNNNCVAEMTVGTVPIQWNANTSTDLLEYALSVENPEYTNKTTTCGYAMVQFLISNPDAMYFAVRGLAIVDRRVEIGLTVRSTHAFIVTTGNNTNAYFEDYHGSE